MKTLLTALLFTASAYANNDFYTLHKGSPNNISYVMLHGDTRTGDSFAKYTQFKPKKHSALFLNADKKTWSIHEEVKYKKNRSFVINTIKKLQSDKVLSKKIVLVGMSTGGLIAADIACTSDVNISGLALISSSLKKGFTCNKPIKTLFIHGTKDPFIKYNKGKSFKGVNLISAKKAETQWPSFNACGDRTTQKIDKDKKDKTSLIINTYKDCNQTYKSITVNGGGHTWLGVKNKFIAKKIIGLSTNEIKANDLLLDYFN